MKRPGAEKGIWHKDVWGNRLQKYQECASTDFRAIEWTTPRAITPYYMLSPIDWTGWDRYGQWWQIADSLNASADKNQIFTVNVLGFQTHRDDFAIAHDRKLIEERMFQLRDPTLGDELIAERYFPPSADESAQSRRDRLKKVAKLRSDAKLIEDWKRPIIPCGYRTMDDRWCYFAGGIMDRPRTELLQHVAGRSNLQLLVSRQIGTSNWYHVSISDKVVESCYISDGTTEQNYCFPISLFDAVGKVSVYREGNRLTVAR